MAVEADNCISGLSPCEGSPTPLHLLKRGEAPLKGSLKYVLHGTFDHCGWSQYRKNSVLEMYIFEPPRLKTAGFASIPWEAPRPRPCTHWPNNAENTQRRSRTADGGHGMLQICGVRVVQTAGEHPPWVRGPGPKRGMPVLQDTNTRVGTRKRGGGGAGGGSMPASLGTRGPPRGH